MQLTRKQVARPRLSGLLSTRQGALALALVCALIAGGILVFALGRYQQSVNHVAPQATVLTATGLIPKGASATVIATEHLYRPTPVLATQMAAGAITDASLLQGRVAVTQILPGQQLKTADFAAQGGVAAGLAPAQRAISVNLDEAHGLTGVVQGGDHVDVYGAFTSQNSPFVGLLVRAAVVLKAPGPAAVGATPTSGGSVVLQVSDSAAPKIAYAAENGKVWLVLRASAAVGPPTGLTTLSSILGPNPNLPSTSTTGAHP